MSLERTTALVTGGASGMGEATARRLAAAGATSSSSTATRPRARRSPSELDGTFAQADVTDEDDVTAAVAAATEVAPLRTCIHCAGIGWAERTINRAGDPHSLDTFRKVVEINLIGTFNVLRLAASGMSANEPDDRRRTRRDRQHRVDRRVRRSDRPGRVLGVEGRRRRATLTAARDLSAAGIRVCTIAPGLIDTPLLGGLPDEARDALAQSVLFPKRLGVPDDFASLAMEIVRNHYLNGEVIRMDAGIRMPPK